MELVADQKISVSNFPTLDDIKKAAERIKPYIHRTPVLTCKSLDRMSGAKLYFKCENFQKIGAFKIRGAANAIFSLSEEEAQRGVATHSSGNHAQAVAMASGKRGIKSHIVMPENAPSVKKAAVKDYGGNIIFCKPTQADREKTLNEVLEKTGATLVHPFNDFRVITGQATAAVELMEEVGDLDIIMTPVGGGGLLSGTLLAVHYLKPSIKVIAGEPKEADDAWRSLKAGSIQPSESPKTIADGLLTALGDKTFAIISKYIHGIQTVTEEKIIEAMKHTWERMKIIIEPSSAVPFGAVLSNRPLFEGKKIGIIITGGNVDVANLPFGRI